MSVTLNTAIGHGSLHREWRRLIEGIWLMPEMEKKSYMRNYISSILSARLGRGANVGMSTALKRMFGEYYEENREYLENVLYDPEKTVYLKISEILDKLKEVKGEELGEKVVDADGRRKRADVNNAKYINVLYKDLMTISSLFPSMEKITASGEKKDVGAPMDREERRKFGNELKEEAIAEILDEMEKLGVEADRTAMRRFLGKVVERYMKGNLKNTAGYELVRAITRNVFVPRSMYKELAKALGNRIDGWRRRRDAEIERYAISNPALAIDVKNVPPEVDFVIDASYNLGRNQSGKEFVQGPAEIFYKVMKDATGFENEKLMSAFKSIAKYSMDMNLEGLRNDDIALAVYTAYRRIRDVLLSSGVESLLYLQPFSSFDRMFVKLESEIDSIGMREVFNFKEYKNLFDLYGYDDILSKIANSFNETAESLSKRGYAPDERSGWNDIFRNFIEKYGEEEDSERNNYFESMMEKGLDPFSFERWMERKIGDLVRRSFEEAEPGASFTSKMAKTAAEVAKKELSSPENGDLFLVNPVSGPLMFRWTKNRDDLFKRDKFYSELVENGDAKVASYVMARMERSIPEGVWKAPVKPEGFPGEDLVEEITECIHDIRRKFEEEKDHRDAELELKRVGAMLLREAKIISNMSGVDIIKSVNDFFDGKTKNEERLNPKARRDRGWKFKENLTQLLYRMTFEEIPYFGVDKEHVEELIEIVSDKLDGDVPEWLRKISGRTPNRKELESIVSLSLELLKRDFHDVVRDWKNDMDKYKRIVGAYHMAHGLSGAKIERYLSILEEEIESTSKVDSGTKTLSLMKFVGSLMEKTGNAYAAFKSAVTLYSLSAAVGRYVEIFKNLYETGTIDKEECLKAFSHMANSGIYREATKDFVYMLSNVNQEKRKEIGGVGLSDINKHYRSGGNTAVFLRLYTHISKLDRKRILDELFVGKADERRKFVENISEFTRRRHEMGRASGNLDRIATPYAMAPFAGERVESPWTAPGIAGGGEYEFDKTAAAMEALEKVVSERGEKPSEGETEEFVSMVSAISFYTAVAMAENDVGLLGKFAERLGIETEKNALPDFEEKMGFDEEFAKKIMSPSDGEKLLAFLSRAETSIKHRTYGPYAVLFESKTARKKALREMNPFLIRTNSGFGVKERLTLGESMGGKKLFKAIDKNEALPKDAVREIKAAMESGFFENLSAYRHAKGILPENVFVWKSDSRDYFVNYGTANLRIAKEFFGDRVNERFPDAERRLVGIGAIEKAREKILSIAKKKIDPKAFFLYSVVNAALLKKSEDFGANPPENVKVAVSRAIETFGCFPLEDALGVNRGELDRALRLHSSVETLNRASEVRMEEEKEKTETKEI